MARRARSWPMISAQARASALEATGMNSGQQVQRSLSGESSANPLLVFMPQLLAPNYHNRPVSSRRGPEARALRSARAEEPVPGMSGGPPEDGF